MPDRQRPNTNPHGLAHARELQGHLGWLDSFSGAALAVLATASGIYTYLGVSSLLDENGAEIYRHGGSEEEDWQAFIDLIESRRVQ